MSAKTKEHIKYLKFFYPRFKQLRTKTVLLVLLHLQKFLEILCHILVL